MPPGPLNGQAPGVDFSSPLPAMVTRLALLIGFALLVSGCTAAGIPSALPPTAGPEPGPRNQLLPIFQRPFAGGFWLSNFFDHEYPFQYQDNNGFQRTFRGEARAGGIDGHNGYDWRMNVGTPILAVADGDVVFADLEEPFFCPPLGRTVSGLFVLLEHLAPSGDRFLSGYAHLDRIDVTRGQRVSTGQQIALSGNTGCSTRPHLHFMVWRRVGDRWVVVDPFGWEAAFADPWALHPQGTQSRWLWRPGQAPPIALDPELGVSGFADDGIPATSGSASAAGEAPVEVPEPPALMLLGSGLALLAIQRARYRREVSPKRSGSE